MVLTSLVEDWVPLAKIRNRTRVDDEIKVKWSWDGQMASTSDEN